MYTIFATIVLIAMCSSVMSFQFTPNRLIPSRFSTFNMMSDDTPKAEWVGAKKFSMKDRYTNTIISSDQISKILPHRYPFLLVDRVGV